MTETHEQNNETDCDKLNKELSELLANFAEESIRRYLEQNSTDCKEGITCNDSVVKEVATFLADLTTQEIEKQRAKVLEDHISSSRSPSRRKFMVESSTITH